MSQEAEDLVPKIQQWFEGQSSERFALLDSWVRMESGSQDKNGIDAFGKAVSDSFAELGGSPQEYLHPQYGNAQSILFPGNNRVALLGHLDTVWPSGTFDAWPSPDSESGWIVGPGALDMKGGIFVALEALRCLRELGQTLPGIEVLLTSDEEIGSPWGAKLIQQRLTGAEACLVLEPALEDGQLKTRRSGISYYELRVECSGGHPGHRGDESKNAVVELASLLVEVMASQAARDRVRAEATRQVVDVPVNVISPHAAVMLDVRFRTDEDLSVFDDEIHAIASGRCEPGLTASVKEVGSKRPPLDDSERNQLLFDVVVQAARMLGQRVERASTEGGSDAGYVAQLGIPVVDGIGPWGRGIHAQDEAVSVAALVDRGALIATTLLLLADQGGERLELMAG